MLESLLKVRLQRRNTAIHETRLRLCLCFVTSPSTPTNPCAGEYSSRANRVRVDRESRIQEIGRELFAAVDGQGSMRSASSLLSGRSLQRRFMNGRQLVNPAELVTEVVDVRHSHVYHSGILARDGIEA